MAVYAGFVPPGPRFLAGFALYKWTWFWGKAPFPINYELHGII